MINFNYALTMLDVCEMLRKSPRMGMSIDEPEGASYIMISDTLAKKIDDFLEGEFNRQVV